MKRRLLFAWETGTNYGHAAKIAALAKALKDCEIIVMRHYEHLTNQEIGQALGLTEPAASMRYLRAIRRLKVILQGENIDGEE